ncbi:MAG: hypothetical protein WA755_05775 [Candidatus Acidiferrales bacterium]
MSVLGSPLVLALNVYFLFSPIPALPRRTVIESIVLCPLAFFMGLGILKKRVYGLILVYVMLVYYLVVCVRAFASHVPEVAKYSVLGVLVWIACTAYYFRRRTEFH